MEWLTVMSGASRTIKVFGILASNDIHWVNEDGYMRQVGCVGNGCPRCAEGDRKQVRHTLGVIDRKDGRPKLMSVGAQVIKAIHDQVVGRDLDRMEFTILRGRDRFSGYEVTCRKSKPLLKSEMGQIIEFLSGLVGQIFKIPPVREG